MLSVQQKLELTRLVVIGELSADEIAMRVGVSPGDVCKAMEYLERIVTPAARINMQAEHYAKAIPAADPRWCSA